VIACFEFAGRFLNSRVTLIEFQDLSALSHFLRVSNMGLQFVCSIEELCICIGTGRVRVGLPR
jgi:hypothetical protein